MVDRGEGSRPDALASDPQSSARFISGMSMTKKEATELIDAEIKWCRENPQNMPEDYRIGFVHGLLQAKRLIRKLPTN